MCNRKFLYSNTSLFLALSSSFYRPMSLLYIAKVFPVKSLPLRSYDHKTNGRHMASANVHNCTKGLNRDGNSDFKGGRC